MGIFEDLASAGIKIPGSVAESAAQAATQGGGEEGARGLGTTPNAPNYDIPPLLWLPEKTKKKKHTVTRGSTGDFLRGGNTPTEVVREHTAGGETLASDVANWVYDDKKRAQIEKYLLDHGYEFTGFSEMAEIWGGAVTEAGNAYMSSGGKIKKSPWDILDLHAPTEEDEWAGATKGRRFKDSFFETTIDEWDPGEITMTLRQTLREMLGRDPSTEEIEDFASRAAAIAHENPSITKGTETKEWDPEAQQYVETGETEATTTGGTSEAMLVDSAMEMSKEDEEYALYQGSTNVYNAIQSALASPV